MICRRGGEYDVVKVLDFGLAKDVVNGGAGYELAGPGARLGTSLFMSPEQIASPDRVGTQSDVYQVGAVGYFLLTGVPVLVGVGRQDWADPEPPSSRLGKPIKRDLEELIMQCLQEQQEQRPNGMRDLIQRLNSLDSAADWDRHEARDWWFKNASDLFSSEPG